MRQHGRWLGFGVSDGGGGCGCRIAGGSAGGGEQRGRWRFWWVWMRGRRGVRLRGDFVGVSVGSMSNLRPLGDGKSLFRADNAALVTLFRTLGIRSLRAGGGSADNASAALLGTSDLDKLFCVCQGGGVRRFCTRCVTRRIRRRDADGAKRIFLEHYGDQLTTFEIEDGPRGSLKEYEEVVKAFAGALKPGDGGPGARFCGPNGVLPWAPMEDADFVSDMAGTGVVSMMGDARRILAGRGRRLRIRRGR